MRTHRKHKQALPYASFSLLSLPEHQAFLAKLKEYLRNQRTHDATPASTNTKYPSRESRQTYHVCCQNSLSLHVYNARGSIP